MAATQRKRAQTVFWYAETTSIITVQRNYRREYGKIAPDGKTIKAWCEKFLATGSVKKESGGARKRINIIAYIKYDIPSERLQCHVYLSSHLTVCKQCIPNHDHFLLSAAIKPTIAPTRQLHGKQRDVISSSISETAHFENRTPKRHYTDDFSSVFQTPLEYCFEKGLTEECFQKADMLMVYDECRKNAIRSCAVYAETYPNGRQPSRQLFVNLFNQLCESGSIMPRKSNIDKQMPGEEGEIFRLGIFKRIILRLGEVVGYITSDH
ncbi:hypothetical protein C0J52_15040 [Blattella germanica]|nr:hypothetical protein C0J52_15040 [Blattella germanica]